MNKYNSIFREISAFLRSLITRRNIIAACIGLAVIVFIIIIIMMINQPKAENTSIYREGIAIVGVATGTEFAEIDESGNITGFEKEYAETLVKEIYGEDFRIEFVSITSQDASYKVKEGEVDFAIGMFSPTVTKTRGMLLTDAYYADANSVIVKSSSDIKSIKDLSGETIGIFNTEVYSSTVKSALQDEGASNCTYISCSSYIDAVDSLRRGNITALVCPSYKIAPYIGDTEKIIGNAGSANYCLMLWTTEKELLELMNNAIGDVKKEKKVLLTKYGIN